MGSTAEPKPGQESTAPPEHDESSSGETGADSTSGPTSPKCGDGVVGPDEECDGGVLDHASCTPACQIECDQGWEDCDGVVFNGCETDLSQNCGACGVACGDGTACYEGACIVPTVYGHADLLDVQVNSTANNVHTQPVTVSAPGVLVGVGIVTAAAAGQMRLGLYADAGGEPGALVAQTALVAVEEGTQTVMLDPVPIAAGTYHIAHDQSTTEARFWGTNDPGVTSSQFAHDVAMPFPDPAAASSQYASATWSEFVLVAQ